MSPRRPAPPPADDSETQRCRWHPQADRAALQRTALMRILEADAAARQQRGEFHLVLAGGETPRDIYRLLGAVSADWAAWHIYFGDERCLPPDDPARNSRMAGYAWLDHVPIPPRQIHPIPGELGAVQAAAAYEETLRTVGRFDLVLLGLGEDGHTASLFPGQDWRRAPGDLDVLPIYDAPKAPPQRVSLSPARLARTRQLIFLVDGRSKRQAVADWRAGKDIPARHIAPPGGVDVLVEASLLVGS